LGVSEAKRSTSSVISQLPVTCPHDRRTHIDGLHAPQPLQILLSLLGLLDLRPVPTRVGGLGGPFALRNGLLEPLQIRQRLHRVVVLDHGRARVDDGVPPQGSVDVVVPGQLLQPAFVEDKVFPRPPHVEQREGDVHVLRVELIGFVDRVWHKRPRYTGMRGEGEDEGLGLVGLVLLLLGFGRGRRCRGGSCVLGVLAHGLPGRRVAVGSKYGVGSLLIVVLMVVVVSDRNGCERLGQFHRGNLLHGCRCKCGVLDERFLSEDLHVDGRRLYDHWARGKGKVKRMSKRSDHLASVEKDPLALVPLLLLAQARLVHQDKPVLIST
jgi:hypothetical protein